MAWSALLALDWKTGVPIAPSDRSGIPSASDVPFHIGGRYRSAPTIVLLMTL